MEKTQTVLIAEDDPSMRRYLEICIKKAGYDVLLAEDGLGGLELALSRNPDIAILDGIMPNMSGYDLARALKANPATKNIPVIILSGMEHAESDGFADLYIQKESGLDKALEEAIIGLLGAADQQ